MLRLNEKRQKVLSHLIRDAMTRAKLGDNIDFKIKHPDWVRDAQDNNYIQLKTEITKRYYAKMEARDEIRAHTGDRTE